MQADDAQIAAELQMQEIHRQQHERNQADSDAQLAARMQEHEQARAQIDLRRRVQTRPHAAPPPFGGPLPLHLRVAALRDELVWRSASELVLGLLLLPFVSMAGHLVLALGISSLVAPLLGLASSRWRDWRLALPHAIATAGALAARAVALPLRTDNLLVAATGVACAAPTVHALWLALRWLVLLWQQGAVPRRPPRARESAGFGHVPLQGLPVPVGTGGSSQAPVPAGVEVHRGSGSSGGSITSI